MMLMRRALSSVGSVAVGDIFSGFVIAGRRNRETGKCPEVPEPPGKSNSCLPAYPG